MVKSRNKKFLFIDRRLVLTLCSVFWIGGHASHAESGPFGMLDLGSSPGRLDENDIVIDLSQSCDLPSTVRKEDVEADLGKAQSAFETLEQLGLRVPADQNTFDANFRVSSYQHKGSKAKFILIPTAHSNGLRRDLRDRNFLISFKQSYAAVQIVESQLKNGMKILNLKEGIKSDTLDADDFRPSGNPLKDTLELYGSNVFFSLGYIYDKDRFLSTNVEDALLFSVEAFNLIGDFRPGMSFDDLMRVMQIRSGPISISRISVFRQAYNEISSWDEAQLAKVFSGICEKRSQKMAEEAIELSNEIRADVVFMTFGFSHAHGIIETLKAGNYSYVLLTANSLPIDESRLSF